MSKKNIEVIIVIKRGFALYPIVYYLLIYHINLENIEYGSGLF